MLRARLYQPPLLAYTQFAADFAQLSGQAARAGGPDPFAAQALGQYRLAQDFVQRAEFTERYPTSLTGAQFVDSLLGTMQSASGAGLPAGERDKLITHFNNGGRALALFHLANDYWNGCDSSAPCVPAAHPSGPPPGGTYGAAVDTRPFIDAEYNKTFVATQFYEYFRRDADLPGYNFWLQEINMRPLRDQTRQR